MSKEELLVKGPLTAIATFTSYMFGMFSEILMVLIVVMVLDYSTGIMRGILTKSLNSTVGLKGLFKKVTMLIIIGLAACIQYVLESLGMDTGNLLVVTVISFFIINEGLSVLENSAQLGVPLPAILIEALEKLQVVGGKEQVLKKVADAKSIKNNTPDNKE